MAIDSSLFPGKFHAQRSLVSYSLWVLKESDTNEQLTHIIPYFFSFCYGDCSHEIKFLGRKVMTNLDSVFKSRDITLPTKVRLVKAMIFPVVMHGCESWTVRRSNQSILKEISPGYSLEGLMLKLKLQYFGHLVWRVDSLEKTLMLGGIRGRRRRGRQRMRWLDSIND